MRTIFSFIGLLLFGLTGFTQDNYDADLIPSNLKNRANATIRNAETVIDMRSPENVIFNVKQAITVLNKNGEDNARLVLFYDKNTAIKSIKGEIYNEAGKLTGKFTQNDFRDESAADGFSLFIDSRVKHYLPSVNTYPYTIVYNYEIRYKQNLIIPDWIPKSALDVSVEKSSYTFICKPQDELRIKTQNFIGTPKELVNEKQKTISWQVHDLPAIRPEPFSPDRETYQTRVKIAAKQFSYFNHKGSYSNWQELGKWIYDDLLKERTVLSQNTIEIVKELVKNENTDKDKARKIYQYLQNKTRYISVQIGIGGFQPVPATEVDRLGYGDCKALVNYMQSLLNVAGIESYYCVVQAGDTKKNLDLDYASMGQGNHIILCLPLKTDTTWLECTSQKTPFGYLGNFTDDRIVLACTATGGKLLHTPKQITDTNLQTRKASLKISTEGSVEGKLTTTFLGSQYENHEEIIGKPLNEQINLLKKAYDIDNINFDVINYQQKKDINPEIIEDLTLNIKNYAPVNNDKLFLQLNAFNIRNSIPDVKNRQFPLYLNRGYTDEDTIIYTLPDEVTTQVITDMDKKLTSPFGDYLSKITLEGKKLTYYRKLVMNEGTFPANQYNAFFKFITDISTQDQVKLIFSLKK